MSVIKGFPTREELDRMKDPMEGRPLIRGDAQGVVCVLSLDIAALRFLAHSLPWYDEFTQERQDDLDEVLRVIRDRIANQSTEGR